MIAAPFVRFVDGMLTDAVAKGASRVWVEPHEGRTRVAYDLADVQSNVLTAPASYGERIAFRLRQLAGLDASSREGEIPHRLGDRTIHFGLLIIPEDSGDRIILHRLESAS
jgi:type IV pilus assembly protein PilB